MGYTGKFAPNLLRDAAETHPRLAPVLKRLEEYLREQQALALPKSQFGKAINYALNQWEALLLYAGDGRLEIDNNSSERTLRPVRDRKEELDVFRERPGR